MSRTYVKFPVETFSQDPDEEAFAVCEYLDGEPSRQVTVAGDRWVTSLEDEDPVIGPTLADQPLSTDWDLEEDEAEEVIPEYFESLWQEALRRGQARS